MSDPGDGYRQLAQPLRTDTPYVYDSMLTLEVLSRPAPLRPTLVSEALAASLDGSTGLGPLRELTCGPALDDRGQSQDPPCEHVLPGSTYLAYPAVYGARIDLGSDASVTPGLSAPGCERCIPRVMLNIAESQIRTAWRKVHGTVEGDDELRPWRTMELVEPRLRLLAERLVAESPLAQVRLGWHDGRGTELEYRDGRWVDATGRTDGGAAEAAPPPEGR